MASQPSSNLILHGQIAATAEKDVFLWIYATGKEGSSRIQDAFPRRSRACKTSMLLYSSVPYLVFLQPMQLSEPLSYLQVWKVPTHRTPVNI